MHPQTNAAADPTDPRELTITRVFDAPADLLYEAYARPEHLVQWFGPRGWPLTLCEVDFRVGGRFRFAMTGPSGRQDTPFGGTYLELVPGRKIVYDNAFEVPGAEKMVVTVTFDERAGRTTLTMRTVFASATTREHVLAMGFEAGVGSGYDQLAELVARLRAAA